MKRVDAWLIHGRKFVTSWSWLQRVSRPAWDSLTVIPSCEWSEQGWTIVLEKLEWMIAESVQTVTIYKTTCEKYWRQKQLHRLFDRTHSTTKYRISKGSQHCSLGWLCMFHCIFLVFSQKVVSPKMVLWVCVCELKLWTNQINININKV